MITFPSYTFFENLSETELILIAKKGCNYSSEAQNALLNKYQPYISKLLNNYPYYLHDDLEMLAYLGILKALKSFDITKNVLLITYAQYFIKKELGNFINNEIGKKKAEINELIIEEKGNIDFKSHEESQKIEEILNEKERIEDSLDLHVVRQSMQIFINELTTQQNTVAGLIFYCGYSSAEVSRQLHISKARVSQIISIIKQKGRTKLSNFNYNN